VGSSPYAGHLLWQDTLFGGARAKKGRRRGRLLTAHSNVAFFPLPFSRLFVLQFSRLAKDGSIVDFGCGYFLTRGRIWPSCFNVLSVSSGASPWFGYLTLLPLFFFSLPPSLLHQISSLSISECKLGMEPSKVENRVNRKREKNK